MRKKCIQKIKKEKKDVLPLTPFELYQFLNIPKPNLNNHKNEKRLHLEVVQHLFSLTVLEKLKAIWFHPPNENIAAKRGHKGEGWQIVMKMMGRISGVPDLVFLWKKGAGFIELKAEKGKLSDNQFTFKRWCAHHDIPFEIAKSWKDVEDILIKWDILTH